MTNRVMVLKLRTHLMSLCTVGLCLVFGSESADAYDPTARLSMAGSFGLSRPAMSDVNDRLSLGNVYMAEQDWIAIDEVHSLFTMGYDIRREIFGNWMLSLGGGSLTGSRGVDFDEVITVEPTTSFFQALAVYRLPWRPSESLRMAAVGGFVTTSGASMTVTHEHRNVESGTIRIEELDLEFTGSGGLGFLETEFIMTERFTLALETGYRFLNTTQDSESWTISRLGNDEFTDADGDGIQNFEDLTDRSYLRRSFLADDQLDSEGRLSTLRAAEFDLDFSGPIINVSLRVYLF